MYHVCATIDDETFETLKTLSELHDEDISEIVGQGLEYFSETYGRAQLEMLAEGTGENRIKEAEELEEVVVLA